MFRKSTSWFNTLRSSAGFTLVEVMVSLGVISVSLLGVNQLMNQFSDSTKNALVADQLKGVGLAAQEYIKDNYATLVSGGVGTTQMITVPAMIASGHLVSGTPTANAFNQSMCVLVLQPAANRLQAMLLTEGGDVVNDIDLGEIAALAGGSAGSVSTALRTTEIVGALGGWAVLRVSYHNQVNNLNLRCNGVAGNVQVEGGHLAMALWLEDIGTQSTMLYRDKVDSMPELNTMNTPIIMNAAQTPLAACTTVRALANDSRGGVLTCANSGGSLKWSPMSATYWGDGVTADSDLGACGAASNGMIRLVRAISADPSVPAVPWLCDGSAWSVVTTDERNVMVQRNLTVGGDLQVRGDLQLKSLRVVDGTPPIVCEATNIGTVAKMSDGSLVICQL